jgi:hypothetical protein
VVGAVEYGYLHNFLRVTSCFTQHSSVFKAHLVMSDFTDHLPSPANIHEATNLCSLPDEILLHVVHSLDEQERQELLCRLFLVNRRLATIAQAELYASPTVQDNSRAHGGSRAAQRIETYWEAFRIDRPGHSAKQGRHDLLDLTPTI